MINRKDIKTRIIASCKIILGLICFLLLLSNKTSGQATDTLRHAHDTIYYQSYPELLTTRLYVSRKFTGFNVEYQEFKGTVFRYLPNTTRNLGIGGTYKWLTLNLAYGFSFLNPDKGEGKTDYLDLQSHIYAGKFNVDLFGQFYKGYYLDDYITSDGETYVRPDLHVMELGISFQYIFNDDKFSFAAAFQNTEYQKKSAGSPLIGFDIFYGRTAADSSLVPSELKVETPDFDRLGFLKIGPQLGYAYTLVLLKNYYLTGAMAVAINGGIYRLKKDEVKDNEYFLSVDLGVRAAAGYNSKRLNIGALYVLQRVQANYNYKNILSTGNIRFIVAYRLPWKNPPNVFSSKRPEKSR